MDGSILKSTSRRLLLDLLVPVVGGLAAIALLLAVPFSRQTHATETTRITMTMLNAASTVQATGTAAGAAIMPACRESAIYVKWSAGVNAGAVTVESSDDSAYAGTWAPLVVVTQTGASREDLVQITGIHLNLRTRISTGVTGGTVSTILGCN